MVEKLGGMRLELNWSRRLYSHRSSTLTSYFVLGPRYSRTCQDACDNYQVFTSVYDPGTERMCFWH